MSLTLQVRYAGGNKDIAIPSYTHPSGQGQRTQSEQFLTARWVNEILIAVLALAKAS
jgi:hypothetical protein